MAKVKISEFDVNPDNNTDINNINIAEGCAPSGINNAIRQLMSDLKEFQTGAGGDSITAVGVYSDTVGEKTSGAGVTVDGVLLKDSGITASGTNVLSGTTIPSSKTLVVTTDIGTSVQAYDADTTKNDVANTFSANQIISVTDNSNAALRITQLGTGNALLVEDSTNPDSTPFLIDASGNVVKGATTAFTGASSLVAGIQTQSAGVSASSLGLYSFTAGASDAPRVEIGKAAAGVGGYASVSSGDTLGILRFVGADGTTMINAAQVFAQVDGTPSTNDMPARLVFSTTADGASSPTERMRIDSAGQVGVGITSSTGITLRVGKNLTGATSVFGVQSQGSIQSDATTGAYMFRTAPSTQATSFTLPTLVHYDAAQSTIGAGSTVTTQYGFVANSSLTGATNNYGFYGNIASGTGRYNFYAAGTADNYFAGSVGIGTTAPDAKFTVESGTQFAIASARTTTSILARGTGTAGAGAYGGSITFAQINSSRPWGAIAGVQYSTDVDQGGLAFFYKAGTATNDTVVEGMRLDAAGNVGIGTSSPKSQLNVSSNITSNDGGYLKSLYYSSGWKYSANSSALGFAIAADSTGVYFSTAPASGTVDAAATVTERMRIDSSGNLLVGTTAAVRSGDRLSVKGAGTQVASFEQTTNTSGYSAISTLLLANSGNTSSYHLWANTNAVGNWYLYGNGTSSFSSDARLKKNIETTRDGYLEDLCQLRVVKYNWKKDNEGTPKELGLIAQEVEQVFAGLVQEDLNPVEEGGEKYKQLKFSVLQFMLLKAIQEQQAIINDLKTRIETLESK